jgi:uncharacterized membrane protein
MDLISFYNENKNYILLGIISIVISIFLFGLFFLPSIFYDQFFWRYFIGPIISDALGYQVSYNGITAEEKFTIISEIVYGFLIIIVLFGLYKLMKKWNVSVDYRFLLAIMPYIIAGSLTRVLEDAEFFIQPLVYLFITPIIYFHILFWFIFLLCIGNIIQNKFKKRNLNVNSALFLGGILFLAPFLYYTVQWLILDKLNFGYNIRFDVFFLIIFLVLIIVFGVILISNFFKKYYFFNTMLRPLNLAMITGHMIDGISSYISIYDPLGMGLPSYYEKHPVSDFIMDIWPPLFPIIKFILVIIIIYVFDILYKKDFERYPRLVNLLKIGIFILGFAPGLRDLLRVMIGV